MIMESSLFVGIPVFPHLFLAHLRKLVFYYLNCLDKLCRLLQPAACIRQKTVLIKIVGP